MFDFHIAAGAHLHLHFDGLGPAQLAELKAHVTATGEAIMTQVSDDLQSIKTDLTAANASISGMRGDIARLNDKIQNMSADAASVAEVKALAAEVAANAGAGDAEGGDPDPVV